MLDTEPDVIRCLVTYTDWWQPTTTSVMTTQGTKRSGDVPPTFKPGFVESIDERWELEWRLGWLDEVDVELLYLYYVANRPAAEIADTVGLSIRQCARRRKEAVAAIADLAYVT